MSKRKPSEIIAELKSLPKTGQGVSLEARLSPEQKEILKEAVDWWKSVPRSDRPSRPSVVQALKKHGIVIGETSAQKLFPYDASG